jgi:hypothetical protein
MMMNRTITAPIPEMMRMVVTSMVDLPLVDFPALLKTGCFLVPAIKHRSLCRMGPKLRARLIAAGPRITMYSAGIIKNSGNHLGSCFWGQFLGALASLSAELPRGFGPFALPIGFKTPTAAFAALATAAAFALVLMATSDKVSAPTGKRPWYRR